jgi:hypothetical protein
MRIVLPFVLASVSFMMPQTASAQRAGPSVLWQRPTPILAGPGKIAAYSARTPDHRWEGVAIGAGVGAIAFGLLGAVACGQSDSTNDCTGIVIGTGLLGVFCGGIAGGLIGGSIPKDEPSDSTDNRAE